MLGGGYYLRGEFKKAIDAGEKSLKLAKELAYPLWYRQAIFGLP